MWHLPRERSSFDFAEQTQEYALLRSRSEIATEVHDLTALITSIPETSLFGQPNSEAIRAQIEVIENYMTFEQVADEHEDGDPYIMGAALDALRWLREDDEAPTLAWNTMIEEGGFTTDSTTTQGMLA